jgi:putative ATP-dependent endonuclease of the OLD family
MRIASVRIRNFRGFADQSIEFGDYTSLVGPNGGGKSSVLTALNVFFRNTSNASTDLLKLEREDFHHRNTGEPIEITVTFADLSPEAQQEFKDYFRHGHLVVSAVAKWSDEDGYATVQQYGQRLGLEAFRSFFRAEGDGEPVAELKKVYADLRNKHPELPAANTKAAMVEALHEYEGAHPEDCTLILSQDQFYGVTKGADRLEKYVQWVFVPAVKDATTEQLEAKKSALGLLLERTVRTKVKFDESLEQLRQELGAKYVAMIEAQKSTLHEVSESLNQRLREYAHPDTNLMLQWQYDRQGAFKIAEPLAEVTAGEGEFNGKLARFGHGLQRSFLLALLEALAGYGEAKGPKLILGCEEPELYQHPPQARHLASVIQKLTEKGSQVIVCTHSPYFVSGRTVESIRSIRRDGPKSSSRCRSITLARLGDVISKARMEPLPKYSETLLKVQQALQPALNEIFFTDVLVLVEGTEDVAYISTYLTLLDQWDEFRRLGCHLVPAGGKSALANPFAVARGLKIPTFVVFDSDRHDCVAAPGDSEERKEKKAQKRSMHEKDNLAILRLAGVAAPDAFPVDTLWCESLVMWNSEIGKVVAADFGADAWTQIGQAVRAKYGAEQGDFNKNSLFIGYRLTEAWEQGKRSATLEALCKAVLAFAAKTRSTPAAAAS